MLICCYHVKVTEVFEGRLYPLINLSALNHTVDCTSGAEAIFKLYILKRIISILTIKVEVENPYRRFSFSFRSRLFIAAKIKSLLLFIPYRLLLFVKIRPYSEWSVLCEPRR